jgi:hypothetical protein
MFKTATATMLASMLKFVPEAQGILAQSASPSALESGTVSPLPAKRINELATQAAKRKDNKYLREFLESKGFAKIPRTILGRQMKAATEDEGSLTADVIGRWYFSEEKQQEAILVYVSAIYEHAGQNSLSRTQIPIVITSDGTAHVVDGDQVIAHKNPPDSLKLLAQYLPLGFPNKNSSDTLHHKRAKAALNHNPCCGLFYDWLGAVGATAAFIACCPFPPTAPVCCPGAVVAAATAAGIAVSLGVCCATNGCPQGACAGH